MTADGIPVHDYIKPEFNLFMNLLFLLKLLLMVWLNLNGVCENGGRGSQVAEIWIINTSVH